MDKDTKWTTLQHNGILFPPNFVSKEIKIKIKGENVVLDLVQEEMVYQWAKKKDAPKPGMTEKYVEDPIFQKNFVSDFAQTFNGKFSNLEYSDIDFSERLDLLCIFLSYQVLVHPSFLPTDTPSLLGLDQVLRFRP